MRNLSIILPSFNEEDNIECTVRAVQAWMADRVIKGEIIVVNGVSVVGTDIPFCDYARGRALDLREFLHSGRNHLLLTLSNDGGMAGLSMSPARSDHLMRMLLALFLLLTLAYSVFLCTWSWGRQDIVQLGIIVAWG